MRGFKESKGINWKFWIEQENKLNIPKYVILQHIMYVHNGKTGLVNNI
eukprot:UN14761